MHRRHGIHVWQRKECFVFENFISGVAPDYFDFECSALKFICVMARGNWIVKSSKFDCNCLIKFQNTLTLFRMALLGTAHG